MARRIVLTVVALISALLVTTVVPLGLLTTVRELDTFREATVLCARALARVLSGPESHCRYTVGYGRDGGPVPA